MKRLLKSGLVVIWILAATCLLTNWSMSHSGYFLPIPESIWAFFDRLYGATCCEDQANVEVLVKMVVFFILVSFITYIALRLAPRFFHRKSAT